VRAVGNHRQEEERSHHAEAEHVRDKLGEQLQVLKFLEYELRQGPDQDVDERTRARAVITALEHLQQAMDALASAARL
jgi:hypothetical protein